jgi:hypothetical protein
MTKTSEVTVRKLPPVTHLCVVSMALVIGAGVYMVSEIPSNPNYSIVFLLVGLSILIFVINAFLLVNVKTFNWKVFLQVIKWTLLAYCVISGVLIYIFVYDKMSGKSLDLLIASLVLFALNVPLNIAFTVARYQ